MHATHTHTHTHTHTLYIYIYTIHIYKYIVHIYHAYVDVKYSNIGSKRPKNADWRHSMVRWNTHTHVRPIRPSTHPTPTATHSSARHRAYTFHTCHARACAYGARSAHAHHLVELDKRQRAPTSEYLENALPSPSLFLLRKKERGQAAREGFAAARAPQASSAPAAPRHQQTPYDKTRPSRHKHTHTHTHTHTHSRCAESRRAGRRNMRRWRGHHHRRVCNHECARRSGKVALGRRLRAASRAEEHPAHAGDLRAAVPRTSPPYPRTSVPAPRRLRLLKPAEEALKTKKIAPNTAKI